MNNFSHDWFSKNIPLLEKYVLPILPPKPYWLELGSFEGRSACWVLENVKDVNLVCVDSWDEIHYKGKNNSQNAESKFDSNVNSRAKKVKSASLDFLVNQYCNPDNLWDVIYIDGDHEAKSVLEDFVLSWKLLKNNGIIVLDDYKFNFDWDETQKYKLPPAIAIDFCIKIYESRSKVLFKGHNVIIQKTGSCPIWCGGPMV